MATFWISQSVKKEIIIKKKSCESLCWTKVGSLHLKDVGIHNGQIQVRNDTVQV